MGEKEVFQHLAEYANGRISIGRMLKRPNPDQVDIFLIFLEILIEFIFSFWPFESFGHLIIRPDFFRPFFLLPFELRPLASLPIFIVGYIRKAENSAQFFRPLFLRPFTSIPIFIYL
jgi:hypothetical protein